MLQKQLIYAFATISFYVLLIATINYSEIAPTGHAPAHAPQEMQVASSISNFPSPSLIAPTGHPPAQLPHEIHESEITYAIANSSLYVLSAL